MLFFNYRKAQSVLGWLLTLVIWSFRRALYIPQHYLPMASLSQSSKQAGSQGCDFMAVEALLFISCLVIIKAWEVYEITLPRQNLLRSVWKFSSHLIFSIVCLGEHGVLCVKIILLPPPPVLPPLPPLRISIKNKSFFFIQYILTKDSPPTLPF